MTSARSMVLSVCASLAALAALALGAQAAPLNSASRCAIDISLASNHVFQNTSSLQSGKNTGRNAAGAVPFASGIETADAAAARDVRLQIAAPGGNTSNNRFADQGISPALSAGLALRRGRRGVDIGEF